MIHSKVGDVAYKDVAIELLKTKCLPRVYYELEACPINKITYDFVIHSVFTKIFVIKSYNVVNECITSYNCSMFDAIYKKLLQRS